MRIIKIIKYGFFSVLSIIVMLLIAIIILGAVNKTKHFEVFGYSAFEVKSYSMYPKLNKGDLVIVKKRENSEYQVGMIVTYLRPSDTTTTTHQIISIDGNVVTTKGINEETNQDADLPFDIECIIGEVVVVCPRYGKVKDFVTNPLGIIIIILTGFLFVEGLSYLENIISKKETGGKEQG